MILSLIRATLASQASNYSGSGSSIASQQIEIVDQMQLKVNELCMKIDQLERELDMKSGAVDRKFCLPSGGGRQGWVLKTLYFNKIYFLISNEFQEKRVPSTIWVQIIWNMSCLLKGLEIKQEFSQCSSEAFFKAYLNLK